MDITVTRRIAAPADRVWALQLDHEHWAERLPNFSEVTRVQPDQPFGVGSSAAITQPGLGTVVWAVTEFEEAPDHRSYSWRGRSRGATYTGSHLVEADGDGACTLTLGIRAEGWFITAMGWMVKGRMQKAAADEAVAFERWAVAG